jgi:hypothetical protein
MLWILVRELAITLSVVLIKVYFSDTGITACTENLKVHAPQLFN